MADETKSRSRQAGVGGVEGGDAVAAEGRRAVGSWRRQPANVVGRRDDRRPQTATRRDGGEADRKAGSTSTVFRRP